MLKVCAGCGVEFEGAAQAKFHSRACAKAFERAKGAKVASKLKRAPHAELTEEEEQALRDFYGYSKTERRSKKERDAAAARMLGKTQPTSAQRDELDEIQAQLLAREREHQRKVRESLLKRVVPSP